MIIDAKLIPVWERQVFENLRAHGVTAASVVCSIWEAVETSSRNLDELQRFVEANADILYLVRSISQLDERAARGRTGIICGWQNSSGFGTDLANVAAFEARGLRIAQPTFITANKAGAGCNEPVDGGLTAFGEDLVLEMNRVGIAIDLAHVGRETAKGVLRVSTMPVFFSQCSPRAMNDAPRNKSDDELRAVASAGGVVALTTLRQYLPGGPNASVDDMADTVLHALNVVGEDGVALGSDLTPGQSREFFEYICHDGGSGRRVMDYAELPTLPGFEDFAGYGNLRRALARKGLGSSVIDKVMSQNLKRYFDTVWSAPESVRLTDVDG